MTEYGLIQLFDNFRGGLDGYFPDVTDSMSDCEAGLHSWIDQVGRLHADTVCKHCGETYGDLD